MPTYTDFVAACKTADDKDSIYDFDLHFLPHLDGLEGQPSLPSPWDQHEARAEVLHQLTSYLFFALKNKDDPWQPIKIMVRAERLVSIYVDAGFDLMEDLQAELQHTLHAAFRLARRQFIKRALLSPDHEFPLYVADMRDPALRLDGPDAIDDLAAVQAHLDHGRSLLDDLKESACSHE
jgi:hypothetical protein